jgi:hypothetical protein
LIASWVFYFLFKFCYILVLYQHWEGDLDLKPVDLQRNSLTFQRAVVKNALSRIRNAHKITIPNEKIGKLPSVFGNVKMYAKDILYSTNGVFGRRRHATMCCVSLCFLMCVTVAAGRFDRPSTEHWIPTSRLVRLDSSPVGPVGAVEPLMKANVRAHTVASAGAPTVAPRHGIFVRFPYIPSPNPLKGVVNNEPGKLAS